jgi:nifR3 family TIM-barrel protein
MDDVTDVAFRTTIARRGKPHVLFTEFTSADGLVLAPEAGQKKLRSKLQFSPVERPIVAQIFTRHPEHMRIAARIVAELGFDGVDINMGCPDAAINKQGCGAELIRHPDTARALIRAAKDGVWDAQKEIPVSVKTRIGYDKDILETWAGIILEEQPAVLTVHARTRNEMSKVPAQWGAVARAVALRDAMKSETLIVGNGDVRDVLHARERAAESGCDGVMIGRGMFGNPWFGSEHVPTPAERIEALIEHVATFDRTLGEYKSFAVMKKHFGSYIHGWEHAKELRMRLMETNDAATATALLVEARAALTQTQ